MKLKYFQKSQLNTPENILFLDAAQITDVNMIRRYIGLGNICVLFHMPKKFEKNKTIQTLIEKGLLFVFVWHVFDFPKKWLSEDRAFADIDEIYDDLVEAKLINEKILVNLFKDEKAKFALKKGLLSKIEYYYKVINCLKYFESYGHKIKFIPSQQWWEMHRLLSQIDKQDFTCEKAVILEKGLSVLKHAAQIFMHIMKCLAVWVWPILQIRKLTCHPLPVKNKTLGIRLFRNSIALKGEGTNQVDWLIDGSKFTNKNTLFIAETALRQDFIDSLIERKYEYIAWDYCHAFRRMSLSFLWNCILVQGVYFLFQVIVNIFRSPTFALEVYKSAWLEYARWSNFVKQWHLNNYIVYNDIAYQQIFRNILMMREGIKCQFYDHSNSRIAMYEMSDDFYGADPLRSFMYYDQEFHWGDFHLGIAKKQKTLSSSLKVCGPMGGAKMKYYESIDQEIKKKLGEKADGMIVLSVFTTVNSSVTINGEDYHFSFWKALLRLLDEFNDGKIQLLIKHKGHSYAESLGYYNEDIKEIYQELISDSRVIELHSGISAQSLIYFSDVTLTMAFASPGVEALIAGKKSLYFDPLNHFPNSYFERIKGYVAHSEEELLRYLKYWFDLDQNSFNEIVNEFCVNEFGLNREQNAADIVRGELCHH